MNELITNLYTSILSGDDKILNKYDKIDNYILYFGYLFHKDSFDFNNKDRIKNFEKIVDYFEIEENRKRIIPKNIDNATINKENIDDYKNALPTYQYSEESQNIINHLIENIKYVNFDTFLKETKNAIDKFISENKNKEIVLIILLPTRKNALTGIDLRLSILSPTSTNLFNTSEFWMSILFYKYFTEKINSKKIKIIDIILGKDIHKYRETKCEFVIIDDILNNTAKINMFTYFINLYPKGEGTLTDTSIDTSGDPSMTYIRHIIVPYKINFFNKFFTFKDDIIFYNTQIIEPIYNILKTYKHEKDITDILINIRVNRPQNIYYNNILTYFDHNKEYIFEDILLGIIKNKDNSVNSYIYLVNNFYNIKTIYESVDLYQE